MGILGLITREAPPANWAEWFLLIVWGGLSVLAVIALPRWALRKNREVRSVERSVSEAREAGLRDGLRLTERANATEREAGEKEAMGEAEIRQRAADFRRTQTEMFQRIDDLKKML